MKQALTIAALAVGFLAGASALSALAQTGATWTAPRSAPPDNNVAAPINVGSVTQQKNGWLGVTGLVTANLTIASGTPGLGNVLVSDANGNASWQSPTSNTTPSCTLLASTPVAIPTTPPAGWQDDNWQRIPIPSQCIDNFCHLVLVTYNSSNQVTDLKATTLTQFDSNAKNHGSLTAYWWTKTGNGADGTGDCPPWGRNGTSQGCDKILLSSSAGNTLGLFDDNPNYSGQQYQDSWGFDDASANYSAELYMCQ